MSGEKLFLDTGWKRWVAENLLRGGPPDELTRVLVKNGFDENLARLEVDTARSHPYMTAATTLVRQRLKRDWVLHTHRMLRESSGENITELWEDVSNKVFFRDFYAINRPLILRGGLRNWPALSKWTPEYLRETVGQRDIEIQARRNADEAYEIHSENHKQVVPFTDFLEQVFNEQETNDVYMTANNSDINGRALSALWADIEPLPAMLSPESFAGRVFFWMGPKGTVTPLHHDLTNNVMAQVIGRKRIQLIAPDYHPFLYNHHHCYSQVDVENVDLAQFPDFAKVRVIEITIGPGDLFFLPVGWWHHVRGLDPSITITCTNFEAPNDFNEHYHTHGHIG